MKPRSVKNKQKKSAREGTSWCLHPDRSGLVGETADAYNLNEDANMQSRGKGAYDDRCCPVKSNGERGKSDQMKGGRYHQSHGKVQSEEKETNHCNAAAGRG